jgi:glycosyltransferase involved in cell wall biosynthesis
MNNATVNVTSNTEDREIINDVKTKRSIKVLMIDPWIGNDYSLFLCSKLSSHGVDVSLIVNEDRRVPPQNFEMIKILPSKQKSFSKIKKFQKYFAYLGRLYSMMNKNEYNIVHFQAFRRRRMESLFFFLLSLKKINLVYTVHDVDPLDWSRTDKLLNNIIYSSATRLIAHSETNKKLLENKYGVDGNKISVVPHGSFDESYPENSISQADAREKLGLNENHNVILFFGAVKEYKGIDLLLKAAAKASEKIKDLVLVIAGKAEHDSLEEEYLEQIKKIESPLTVIPHFKFIEKNEVEIYFRAADAAALPYRIISHSGVLHLAYSYGKPVIASRVGDFEEFIHEDETGFLSDKENIGQLSDSIIKAFSSKNKLKEMGEYARKINSEQYSWDASAGKLKEVYKFITGI